MTNEDFEQLRRVGRHLQELDRVGLVSPVPRRSRRRPWRRVRVTERAVFPRATVLPRGSWDLNEPTEERFDLLVASNVFMYSRDPERWFANVLDACAYFLLIDLVRRQRSSDSEFGRDGDSLRFRIGEARPRVTDFFDLDALGSRVLGSRAYPGGANAFDASPLHAIVLMRGDGTPDRDAAAAIRSAQTELGDDLPA